MALTYDARLYSIEIRKDRPKPYRLRWLVGERKHSKSYALKVQAEGRRSELMSAARRGDQFDEETGLPVSELRTNKAPSRGTSTAARTSTASGRWRRRNRKNYADALATITPALVRTRTGMPETALIRRALYGWRTTGSAGMRPRRTMWHGLSLGSPSTPCGSPRWKTRRPCVWP